MAEMRVIGQQTEVLSRVREWMGPDEELALLIHGDTSVLKRMRPPRLSEMARRVPDDEEVPLEDIVAEVHRYRQEKRNANRR
ncbi:MAG TPA: hypothetical protein EYH32_07135 [Anaerolineae bacterium]|nr:hypothetical protein [Anaerolineae bacterium]